MNSESPTTYCARSAQGRHTIPGTWNAALVTAALHCAARARGWLRCALRRFPFRSRPSRHGEKGEGGKMALGFQAQATSALPA